MASSRRTCAATTPRRSACPSPAGRFASRRRWRRSPRAGSASWSTRGPNVMLGYADAPADLGRGREVDRARAPATWPVGARRALRGRRPPQPVRASSTGCASTSTASSALLGRGRPRALVGGDDRRRRLRRRRPAAATARGPWRAPPATAACPPRASGSPSLATGCPLHPNGKPDYARAAPHRRLPAPTEPDGRGRRRPSASRLRRAAGPPRRDATRLSFVDLGGDSLSYVELASTSRTARRRCPPTGTPAASATSAPGGHRRRRDRRRPRLARSTPASRCARARDPLRRRPATDLVRAQGGAHVLLALAGFNFARFQLTAAGGARDRLRHGLSGLAQLVVPSVLWVGAVAVVLGSYDLTTALFVRELLDSSEWDDQWQLWFLESLVWITAAALALTCVPALHRLERRTPFRFALAAARPRGRGPVRRRRPARRSHPALHDPRRRLRLRARLARRPGRHDPPPAWSSPCWPRRCTVGFFGQPQREAIVLGGFLLMLWLPHVSRPRVARPSGRRPRRRQPLHLPHPLAGLPPPGGRRATRGSRSAPRSRSASPTDASYAHCTRLSGAPCSGRGSLPSGTFPGPRAARPRSLRVSLQKVLIANRGEIAVRVIRACKDAGIGSRRGLRRPGPRRAARPARRRGATPWAAPPPAESYLDIDKILDGRRRRPAPTPSTPATASSPRTPTSPRPSSTPA